MEKDPRRFLYVGLGSIFVGLGALGILLPVLPTTPFILLAAACYARGSERAHAWLNSNRFFGPTIRDWQRTGGLTLKTKILSIVLLWLTIVSTAIFFVELMFLRILLLLVAFGVTVFLCRIPTHPANTVGNGDASL